MSDLGRTDSRVVKSEDTELTSLTALSNSIGFEYGLLVEMFFCRKPYFDALKSDVDRSDVRLSVLN